MRKFVITLALTVATTLASFGFAATLTDVQALYAKGDVSGTVSAGTALNTSAGYVLAAEATSLGADLLPKNQREAAYAKAEEYARKAVQLDANNPDAYMEVARAVGRLAQFKGVLQSLNLAGEVKKNLDTALKLNPKLPAAYIALGLWNAEVPLVAGGSSSQVEVNILRAIELEPTTIIHRIEYANALLKLSKRNKRRAVEQLEQAVKFTPKNFWDKIDLETAKRNLAALK